MNETVENTPGAELGKLTSSAMLALSSEAEEELARDFSALKVRLDAVVRSDAASGQPAEGPIHAEVHPVLPPEEAEKRAAERERRTWGRELLRQADRFDGTYAVVPRVV